MGSTSEAPQGFFNVLLWGCLLCFFLFYVYKHALYFSVYVVVPAVIQRRVHRKRNMSECSLDQVGRDCYTMCMCGTHVSHMKSKILFYGDECLYVFRMKICCHI